MKQGFDQRIKKKLITNLEVNQYLQAFYSPIFRKTIGKIMNDPEKNPSDSDKNTITSDRTQETVCDPI